MPGSWEIPALQTEDVRLIHLPKVVDRILGLYNAYLNDERTFQAFATAPEHPASDREVAVAAREFLQIYLGKCFCAELPDYEPPVGTEGSTELLS